MTESDPRPSTQPSAPPPHSGDTPREDQWGPEIREAGVLVEAAGKLGGEIVHDTVASLDNIAHEAVRLGADAGQVAYPTGTQAAQTEARADLPNESARLTEGAVHQAGQTAKRAGQDVETLINPHTTGNDKVLSGVDLAIDAIDVAAVVPVVRMGGQVVKAVTEKVAEKALKHEVSSVAKHTVEREGSNSVAQASSEAGVAQEGPGGHGAEPGLEAAPTHELTAKLKELEIEHTPVKGTSFVTQSKKVVYVAVPKGMESKDAKKDLKRAAEFALEHKLHIHIHSEPDQIDKSYLQALQAGFATGKFNVSNLSHGIEHKLIEGGNVLEQVGHKVAQVHHAINTIGTSMRNYWQVATGVLTGATFLEVNKAPIDRFFKQHLHHDAPTAPEVHAPPAQASEPPASKPLTHPHEKSLHPQSPSASPIPVRQAPVKDEALKYQNRPYKPYVKPAPAQDSSRRRDHGLER